MLIWKLPEYRDAIDGDGSDFVFDQQALEEQNLSGQELRDKSNGEKRTTPQGIKPNTSIQGGSLDDSLKHGTERTSLLGDPKGRKKSEALDEDGEIEDDGKMTKM